MNKDGAISIYLENIEEFSRRSHLSELQRDGQTAELIAEFIDRSSERDASAAYGRFLSLLPSASKRDRALLCRALSLSRQYGAELWRTSFFGAEDIPAGAHGRVAIVRNRYNEQAFTAFSAVITTPKVTYVSSFTEACEDVSVGNCEFCILPVENSQSGRLFGFYSMLDRYELKICALCRLDGGNPSESIKYALVGRAVPDRIPKNLDWCFECSVVADSGAVIGDISGICGIFEGRLLKVDSLPVEYDENLQKYYFTFGIPEKCISGFELYLSREYARYSPIGLYPTVKPTAK